MTFVDVESSSFARDLRMHDDEQKQIAQFLSKVRIIFGAAPRQRLRKPLQLTEAAMIRASAPGPTGSRRARAIARRFGKAC